MFGKFKKVSTEEQRMLAKVAMELIDKISENNHLLSGLTGEQFIALRRYEKAVKEEDYITDIIREPYHIY